MPKRPGLPCNYTGCAAILESGQKGYCKQHKKAESKYHDRSRPSAADRGYGAQWRKIRARVLSKEPLCRRCKEMNRITAASVVHHADENTRNTNINNLIPMCETCHNKHHGFGRKKAHA